jgi:hypothetical protein
MHLAVDMVELGLIWVLLGRVERLERYTLLGTPPRVWGLL